MRAVFVCVAIMLLFGRPTIAATAEMDDAQLAQQLKQLDTSLLSICDNDCYFFDESEPRTINLLTKERTLLERHVLQYLASHVLLDNQAFTAALPSLGESFDADVVRLDRATSLASIHYGPYAELGEVFIVSSRPGRLKIKWRRPSSPCGKNLPHGERCFSAIALGLIGNLPTRPDRNHFFYIYEYERAEAGCGITGWLSVWKWEGRKATRLLAKKYPSYCDSEPPRFDGKVLHIDVKREYKMSFSGAAGPARQMDWKIAIGQKSITDLGEIPKQPEVALIDELMYRIAESGNAEQLASSSVIAFVHQNIAKLGVRFDASAKPLSYGDDRLTRRSNDTVVCLELHVAFEAESHPYLFTIAKIGTKRFVSSAELPSKALQEELCPQHQE